jgi:hypothetical protein
MLDLNGGFYCGQLHERICHRRESGQVPGVVLDHGRHGRADASAVGGGGSFGFGLGRNFRGVASNGSVAQHHLGRRRGVERTTSAPGIPGARAAAPSRRGSQTGGAKLPRHRAGIGSSGGSGDAQPSRVALALDLQEHAQTGRRTRPARLRRVRSHGGRPAARGGLQPASQSQDAGREVAPRSRCPIPAHSRSGAAPAEAWATGRGGHRTRASRKPLY